MKTVEKITLLLVCFLMVGCAPQPVNEETPIGIPEEVPTATSEPTATLTLEQSAARVINALAEKDLATVASFVHPDQGVRFSPYAFVQEDHLVFLPGELPGLVGSDTIYTWGQYDGSGEPIELTFDAYYDEFIYSSDFANPEQKAVDSRLGEGNSINNIHEFYLGSRFVEYHFSGFDEQYGGMDWESLRLVFIEENGIWYLVGIVHDEWTI